LGNTSIGVEVKYRNQVQDKDALKAARLAQQLGCAACIVVSKNALPAQDRARMAALAPLPLVVVPLAALLMLF
jgi:tRNA-dihydrouridine synthase